MSFSSIGKYLFKVSLL